jgi:hypothetical protein
MPSTATWCWHSLLFLTTHKTTEWRALGFYSGWKVSKCNMSFQLSSYVLCSSTLWPFPSTLISLPKSSCSSESFKPNQWRRAEYLQNCLSQFKTSLNEKLLSTSTSALAGCKWKPSRSGHSTSGKTAPPLPQGTPRRRLGGPQSRSACFEVDNNPLPLLEIEPQFFICLV